MANLIQNELYDYVVKLEKCSDIEEVKAICSEYLKTIGIHFYKYSWTPPATKISSPISFFTCAEQWVKRYTEQNFEQADPKTQYANDHHIPIVWDAKIIKKNLVKKCSKNHTFWQDSIDIGLASGITIPIRGIAGSKGSLCIAYDCNKMKDGFVLLPSCEVWSMYLHNQIEKIYMQQQLHGTLSKREEEVLKWIISGKTSDEVSKILCISQNTVLFHLKNLRYKLDVHNKHHLIARALSLGLVSL